MLNYEVVIPKAKKFREGRDFPGGPVVETPQSQCRGPRFHPWAGN